MTYQKVVSSKMHSFLCPHFSAKFLTLVTLPVLTYGD